VALSPKISFPAPIPGSFAGAPNSNPPNPVLSIYCSCLGGSLPMLIEAKLLFISVNGSGALLLAAGIY